MSKYWQGKNQGGPHNQGLVSDEETGKTIAVVYDAENTRLIAMAPRMLEALEALVEVVDKEDRSEKLWACFEDAQEVIKDVKEEC